MSADDVGADDAALRAAAQARLAKHGVTLDEDNVQLVIRHIADYPEIIAAALAAVPRPVTQPEGDEVLTGGEVLARAMENDKACICGHSALHHGAAGGTCPHCDCSRNYAAAMAFDSPAYATPSQPAHGETLTDREALGRQVREVWVEWATEQADLKPSWLVPWEGLSEPDREVDRRIGEALYRRGLAAQPAHGDNEAALPRLLAVPSEEAMFALLSALNVSGVHCEFACVDGHGSSFLATLTEPDADYVHIVRTDESGREHCCECSHDGGTCTSFSDGPWPSYPVTVVVTEWPDFARAAEDGYADDAEREGWADWWAALSASAEPEGGEGRG